MSISSKIHETISNSTFCYAKTDGEGFVPQSDCACHREGNQCCQAYHERSEFFRLYAELEQQGLTRQEILAEIRNRFNWNETDWIQHNVSN